MAETEDRAEALRLKLASRRDKSILNNAVQT